MIGPGKYDKECSELRDKIGGEIAVIIVGGNKGGGFSVQMSLPTLKILPGILRDMANRIESDYKNLIK